ncbi:MAG TPA: aldehyde dehydrogenase family protein, partial [Steroidobacteraceae bacterium]|nr:aldehyde dehydrogenase family protein [Steroidobacteraceae bacterium]
MNAQLQTQPDSFRLLINGRLVEGASTFDVINPATEEVLACCPRADLGQLNQAVAAAKAALPAWSATPIAQRRALLMKLADALGAASEDFARLLTQEQGKPLNAARGEVGGTIYILRTLAGLDLPVEVLKEEPGLRIVRHHAPLGVIAAITPWNFPLILLATKIAPALLAGNTLVAKPAPTTP